jgi:hypothetical protein
VITSLALVGSPFCASTRALKQHVNGIEDIVSDDKEELDGFILITLPVLKL